MTSSREVKIECTVLNKMHINKLTLKIQICEQVDYQIEIHTSHDDS